MHIEKHESASPTTAVTLAKLHFQDFTFFPTPARFSASKETFAWESGPFFAKKMPVDLVRSKKFFSFNQSGRGKGTWEEQGNS